MYEIRTSNELFSVYQDGEWLRDFTSREMADAWVRLQTAEDALRGMPRPSLTALDATPEYLAAVAEHSAALAAWNTAAEADAAKRRAEYDRDLKTMSADDFEAKWATD